MYIEDMRTELAEYYECAGFKDVYNRVIKYKTDEEIIKMYMNTSVKTKFRTKNLNDLFFDIEESYCGKHYRKNKA